MPEPLLGETCENIRALAGAFRLVEKLFEHRLHDPVNPPPEEEYVHYHHAYEMAQYAFFVLIVAAFEKGLVEKAKDEGSFRQRLEEMAQDTALAKKDIERVMQIWKDRSDIAHGDPPVFAYGEGEPAPLADELIEIISKLQTRMTKDYKHWLPDPP